MLRPKLRSTRRLRHAQRSQPSAPRRRIILAGSILTVFGLMSAHGATSLNWDPSLTGTTFGGSSGPWDAGTTPDWFNGISDVVWPNDGSIALFGGSAGTVLVTGAVNTGGLVFNTSGYIVQDGGSGSIRLTTAGAGAAGLSFPAITVNGAGSDATISLQLTGTNGLAKLGDGTLFLTSNSDSYTGDTVINAGALVITNQQQLGAGTTAISINGIAGTGNPGYSGGQLVLNGGGTGAGLTLTREVSISGRGPGAINASGGLVSIGNNTLAGHVVLGGSSSLGAILATHGVTTISGNLQIGTAGNTSVLYGNGNYIVSGQVTGYEIATDRFAKAGQVLSTTLWLQNAANNFAENLRIDSGTVRVSTNSALGNNTSTQAVDLNNGTLEIRTDTLGTGAADFSTRKIFVRDNTSDTVFVGGDLLGSAINQTGTFGETRITGVNTTFSLTGRDGFSAVFTGLNNSPTSTLGVGGAGPATINNNSNGLLTLAGTTLWNQTDTTARLLTIQGNGDTLLTGSIAATGSLHAFTKAGTGLLTILGTASTFTGNTTLSAGTLNISSIGALNATAAGGRVVFGGGALNYTGAGETWTNKGLTLNATNNILTNNGTGGLALPQNVANNGTGLKNLVLGGANTGTNDVQGLVTNTTVGAGVTKLDGGNWQISTPGTTAASIGTSNPAFGITAVGTTASGTITTGSTTGLVVGQPISGTGVPFGAVITQIVSPTQFNISQNATSTGATVVLGTVTGATAPVSVTANTGNLLTVGSTANLVPGQTISGTGLAAGAVWYISAINSATTFTVANTTGAAALANSAAIGNQTPNLSPSFAGPLTISGGTVTLNSSSATAEVINDSASVIFAADPIRANGFAGGTLNYKAFSGGSTETAGVLSVTAGAGTVQITPTAGTTNALTFGSLVAPSLGTSLNFVVPAGTGSNTNGVSLIAAPAIGLLNAHAYYNGANFVYNPATTNSTLRAPVYGSDAGFTTVDTLTAGTNVAIDTSLPSGALAVTSLKIAGSSTLNLTGTLTVGGATGGGVLLTGGTGGLGQAGGGAVTTNSAGDLALRVDGSSDVFTLAVPVTSTTTGGLTKNGLGTLILSGANAESGTVTINEGTIRLAGTGTLGANNVSLTLRQNTTLDLNGVSLLSTGTPAAAVNALSGAGTITNSAASGTVTLQFGNGNTGSFFSGLIQDGATAKVALTKSGTGTNVFQGTNTYTGPTLISGGNLDVSLLADIGSASGIGKGDPTTNASNAASLVFNGGALRYVGTNAGGALTVTQSPSVSINRLFTLAGNGAIASFGSYGNDVATRVANNATVIFNNTNDVVFSGATGARNLTVQGDSAGDNEMRVHLVDNNTPSTGFNVLGLSKLDAGLWILNPSTPNTYTGPTVIQRGALQAIDGVGLSAGSLVNFNDATGGVLQTSGTFARTVGTAPGNLQWSATGSGGFAASSARLTVNLGSQVWGNPTVGFLGAGNLILSSTTALSDVVYTGGIDFGGGAAASLSITNTTTNALTLTSGTTAGLQLGQTIAGPNIPVGSIITGITDATHFTINNNATAANTAAPASASTVAGGTAASLTVTTTAASPTLTVTTGVTDGIVPGQPITGTNIPANSYVLSVSGSTITLNQNATTGAAGNFTTLTPVAGRIVQVDDNGSTGLDFATLSGVLSGVGGLTKTSGGTLILGDTNTYTGATALQNGALVVTSIGASGVASSSLGANSGAGLVMGSGGNAANLLYVGNGEVTTRPISLTGTTGTETIDSSGAGALVLSNVTNNVGPNAFTFQLRGTNTDGNMVTSQLGQSGGNVMTLTKSDGGVWILNPSLGNTFTGNINANGGLLGLTSLGIGLAGNVSLTNGGVFAYGGDLTTSTNFILGNNATAVFAGSNNITVSGTLTKASGANDQTISNNLDAGKTLTFSGNFIDAETTASATRTINLRGYGATIFNGIIQNNSTAGTSNLLKLDIRLADSGSVTLGANNAGSTLGFTGGILLGQGTLIVGDAGGLGPAANAVVLDGGFLQAALPVGDLTGANKILNKISLQGDQVTLTGSESIELGGAAVALDTAGANRFLRNELTGGATLTISGPVNLTSDTTARTLTLRGAAPITVSGIIANGVTAGSGLAYSGTSTLTLTAPNTATGALTVNRNTVVLSGAGATGGAWNLGTVTLNPTGILRLDNSAGNDTALTGGTAGRLSDTLTLIGQGGTLDIIGASGGTTELVGPLMLNSVQTFVTLTDNSGGAGNNLTFASVAFANSGSALNLTGVPSLGTTNKVKISAALASPAIVNGILPRTFIAGGTFATYDTTNGVQAFTNYNPTSATNINLAAATDTVDANATLTTSSLTASRTINALRINGSGISVGGANRTLTLTSGALLNTGGDNSLDLAAVNFTNTPIIQVAAGTTLSVNSTLISAATNFAKALPGTLQLNTPSFVTGTQNVLAGTLKLNGGLNTLFPVQLINMRSGATLDLNGNTQYAGQLSDPGVLPGVGGLLTSSTGSGTIVANQAVGSTTFATTINGNVNLGRVGANTLTFESANTYTGATSVLGGTLQLQDDATILNTSSILLSNATLLLNNNSALQRALVDRVGDATPITLRTGTISFTGKVSDASTEMFGAVAAAEGASTVTVTAGGAGTAGAFNSADVTFASLSRAAGTTVNFTGTSLGSEGNNSRLRINTPGPTFNGGVLGAWAIANTTDYAAYNTVNGVGVVGNGGFAGYDALFGTGKNTDLGTLATAPLTTTLSLPTTTSALLKVSGNFTNNIAFAIGSEVLNLELGGILRSNNVFDTSFGTAAKRGVITAGGTETSGPAATGGVRELIVYNNATGNPSFGSATINPTTNVVTLGSTQGLQPGLTVSNANFPAGTTVVSVDSLTQVTLSQVSTNATQQTSQTLAGGSYVSGVTTLNSAVVTANSTTGVAPGMTITGTNIPTGTYVVSVDSPTQLTLSQASTAAGSALTFTLGVSNLIVNSVIADNGSGNSVSLVKSGAGILNLSANNRYTGGTVVNQGMLNLIGSGVVIPANATTGLTITNGTVAMLTNAGQIDPSNRVTLNGSSTLTLSLTGNNTLSGLTFNNNGGTSAPTVTVPAGTTLSLTSAAPVTVTSANAATLPVIATGTLALGAGNKTFDIQGPTIQTFDASTSTAGSQLYSKINAALNITSVITGTGAITKSNNGILQLSGQNTFNGLNLTGGGILISGNSTPTTGGGAGAIGSGPLGVGSVSASAGTEFLVDGSRSIGNNINFAGNPIFDSTANTVWTLALNGAIGLPSGAVSVQVINPFLTVNLLGSIPNIGAITSFTKTGAGTLNFNSTGYTGNFNVSNLGAGSAITLFNDGDGYGDPETVPLGSVIFDAGVVPNITVSRAGGTLPLSLAANKILAPSSVNNVGLGLTVTNSNGYGLSVPDSVTIASGANFNVANATASNVTQGLYLNGVLSGTTGLTKSGPGTLVLANNGNTLSGTVNITQGVVSISSDGQLGTGSTIIALNPTTGTTPTSTLRATGTFTLSSGHTIQFTNTANTRAIEVVAGRTLTLLSPFDLNGNPTASLAKNDNGVLELATAEPNTWTGGITVNAGAVLLSNSAALGSTTNAITVGNNGVGAAIQLANNVNIPNAITLTSAGGGFVGGINSGGQIESVFGTNTWSGPITFSQDVGLGADAGATLNLIGGINQGGHILTFAGAGNINVANTPITNVFGITKIGTGTTMITVNVAAGSNNGPTINAGILTLSGAGALAAGTKATVVNPGGTLNVDDTGTPLPNRLGGNLLTLQGGNLNYIGSALGNSAESVGAPTFSRGYSVVTVTAQPGEQSDLTFAANANGTAQNQNSAPTGATVLFRGTNLGSAAGAGNATIKDTGATTGFTFVGQAGATGTVNKGLLSWALIDSSATGSGTSFATGDAAAGFTVGILRPLASGEYLTANTFAANDNINLTTGVTSAGAANLSINSLTMDTGAGVTVGNLLTLTNLSGGILVKSGSSTISGGVLSQPLAGSGLTVWTIGDLAISSTLTGGNGVTNGSAGLVKAGAGTLTLSTPATTVPGVSSGANTFSGLVALNQGTLKLNGGRNTLQANNYLEVGFGSTLDLNGTSQQVYGLFTDGAVNGAGGAVTSSAGAGNLITNEDTSRNWAGAIGGGTVASGNYVSFTRSGQGTLTFYSPNPYAGPTLINGGVLTLRDNATLSGTSAIDINYATLSADNNAGTIDLADRINNAAPITLRGGTLTVQGRAQTASSEALGAISIDQGFDVINPLVGATGVNSIDVSLAGLARTAGSSATLIIQGTNLGTIGSNSRVTTASLNGVATGPATPNAGLTNNIVGGWAENGNDFLTYSPVLGFAPLGQTGALQYDFTNTFIGAGPTKNVRLTAATTVPAGGATVYALSMSGSNIALPFNAATDTLNIVSGGLIGPNNTQPIGTTALPGKLTAGGLTPGAASDLYVFNRANTLTINSSIIDNVNGGGSAVRAVFTASGGAITLVNPASNYTGGTVVNGGTLNLTNTAATAVVPLASVAANGLVLNGATVTMNGFAGQIALGNVVTLNGSSTLNLFTNNTLTGLVFNNNGGTSAPTVNTFQNSATPSLSSSGILTIGSAGIVATSSNVGTTSTIAGRVDFGLSANTISVDTINANGTSDVAPLQAGFALQGVVGSGGGITKNGAGVLGLNAQEIFTGPLTVANGALRINAVSGGSRFSDLTLNAGTRLDLGGLSTTFGSLAGAGLVFNSGNAGTLTVGFDGASSTFSGSFNRFSDAVVNAVSLTKIGAGTLTLTGAGTNSTSTGVLTVNRGNVSFKDSGTNSFTTSAIVVNEGATLTLDDRGASNLTNRLSNTALTVNGGTLSILGAAGAASAEASTATLTLGGSASAINLTPGNGGTVTITFASLTQGANGTANITGTNLGTDSKLLFTATPALANGILARYAVNTTDFATYAAGTGVTAYAGYVTPTDLNAATSTQTIKVDATTTTTALTAARTVNALDVIANNVSITASTAFLPTQGLTVGSGGVLINGNNAAINTPALALSAEGIFRVNGNSLAVNGSITGSAGITKTGTGTLFLNARQNYTGTTTQNVGNITLAGGNNTIAVVPTATTPTVSNLIVNGGTFDLNGNSQAVGTISNNNVLAFLDGTITNSSAATPAVLTSVAAGNSSFGGTIAGNLAFTKSGNNTLTLADVQTYTGATVLRGGNLTLQDKGALYSGAALTNASVTLNYGTLNWNNANYNTLADLNPTRLPAAVPVTLQGGVLTVNGGGSIDTTIALNTLNVAGGGSSVNVLPFVNEGSTVKLTVGNLVRNPTNHSVINFNGFTTNNSSGISTVAGQGLSVNGQLILSQVNGAAFTSANLVNNLIGGWAVVDGSSFATYVDGVGVTGLGTTVSSIAAAGFTGTDITAATVASGNYNDGTAHTVTGAHVANTWRISFAASASDTLATATAVTLGTGIITNANLTTTIVGTDATSTIAGAGADLVVFTNQATTNLNVKITGGASLVKAGGAILGLAPTGGSNDYTGGTFVQGGTLNLNAAAGLVAIPGDLTINNSTVTMVTNSGQIAATANIFVNGGGVLTTVGSNTLSRVTFQNDGGNGTPTVNGATALTLTSLTPITSANDSLSFTPTISGTALSFTSAANALVAISTSGLSPDDLIISAPITGTGTAAAALNKVGPGSLVLGAANTFNASTNTAGTGVQLSDGTLILNNAAALGNVANTLTIGDPVNPNSVPLTLLAGSAALTTAANPVVVNRDFTFGGVAAGNSLNLAGPVNLGSVNRTISVSGLLVTGTLSGVVTSTATGTALTKTGPGTLVLSNAGNSIGTAGLVVSAGVLKSGVANVVGNANLLTVNSGAFFDLGGFGQISQQISGGGTIFNSGGSATFVIGGTTATDTTTNLSSGIGGFGATTPANLLVTKVGLGSLTVTGAGGSNYSGATTVVSGSLVGGAVNAFSPISSITVGNATTSTAGLTATLDTGAFDQTIGGLIASPNTATGTAAINIGAGRTLTVNGPVTFGSSTSTTDVTNVNFTGSGTLVVGNTGTFQVGGATAANADSATVNLSTLTSFTANLGSAGTFRVGDNNGTNGGAGSGVSTITLATNNTINAGTVAIGDTENVTNALSTLKLGSGVNAINANTITVSSNPAGGGRGNGTLNFATVSGTLTVRAFDGVSPAALNIVNAGVTATGTTLVGLVDLTGHSADLLLSALTLANRASGNTGAGPGTATLSFDTGTLVDSTLSLSNRGGTDTVGQLTSTLNIGGGTASLGTVTVGVNTTASATGGSTGTLNVTGGTVAIASLSLSGANAAGAVSTGTLNLTGGTVTVSGDITRATTPGTQNTTLTLNGATLDMGGNNIGSVSGPIGSGTGALTFQSGTLKNVNLINGTDGLTKTTGGFLIVDGTNNYTGATVISAGTLQLGNGGTTGTINPASAITDNANLFFKRSNTVTQGTDFASSISGLGAVTQAGSGTLVLSGVNSYQGGTTLNAGITQINSTSSLGAASGAATINNATLEVAQTFGSSRTFTLGDPNSAIAVDAGQVFTLNSNLNGAGALNATGPGRLELSGTNGYAGPTNIKSGTLAPLASGSISGNIAITAGATFDVNALSGGYTLPVGKTLTSNGPGTATVSGVLNVAGTVAPGGPTALGTLAVTGGLTLGGTLQTELAAPGSSDLITTPSLTLQPGSALSVALLNGYHADGNGTLFTLINNTGAGNITGTFSNTVSMSFGTSPLFDTVQAPDGEYFAVSYKGDAGTNSFTGGNDVVLMAVPEPSALGALLTGLASLAGLQRFRRRSATRA